MTGRRRIERRISGDLCAGQPRLVYSYVFVEASTNARGRSSSLALCGQRGSENRCPATDQLAIDVLVVVTWTLVVARVVFLSYSYPWLVHSVGQLSCFRFLVWRHVHIIGNQEDHSNQPYPVRQMVLAHNYY